MKNTQQILRGVGISTLMLLAFLVASGTATVVCAAENFSLSNVVFYSELERTNPALFKATGDTWRIRKEQMKANVYRTIPYLREFSSLYPSNIEFQEFSREATGAHVWAMQTGVYGRHILRLNVPFKVDATWTNLLSFDAPRLTLITYHDAPPSTRGISKGREFSQTAFASADWTNLVQAGGNLAGIGFKGWTNRPIEGFELEWRNRK